MKTGRNIPPAVYKLMLLAATVIWGFAFVVMKDSVDVLAPAQLIGVRFTLTALLMAAVFHKHLEGAFNKECLKAGFVLALVTFLAFWVQTVGLTDTSAGKNAFLTATYCVIVPFMMWALGQNRPTVANLGAAVLCIVGIGCVSLSAETLSVGFGDAMTLLCAFFFAAQIIAISRYSKRHDVLALTVYQFLFGGLMGLALGFATEPAPALSAVTSPDFLLNLAYLVVFASALCYVLQNVGLAHVPPAQGSLLLCLESVFGVVASVLLQGELLTARMVFGFGLIFCAVVLSELGPQIAAKLGRRRSPDATTALDDEADTASA